MIKTNVSANLSDIEASGCMKNCVHHHCHALRNHNISQGGPSYLGKMTNPYIISIGGCSRQFLLQQR